MPDEKDTTDRDEFAEFKKKLEGLKRNGALVKVKGSDAWLLIPLLCAGNVEFTKEDGQT